MLGTLTGSVEDAYIMYVNQLVTLQNSLVNYPLQNIANRSVLTIQMYASADMQLSKGTSPPTNFCRFL